MPTLIAVEYLSARKQKRKIGSASHIPVSSSSVSSPSIMGEFLDQIPTRVLVESLTHLHPLFFILSSSSHSCTFKFLVEFLSHLHPLVRFPLSSSMIFPRLSFQAFLLCAILDRCEFRLLEWPVWRTS